MYNFTNICVFSMRILPSAFSRINLAQNFIKRNASSQSNFAKFASAEIQNDPDRERKLKVLMLEVDVFRQEGRKAPDPEKLSSEHWNHLLTLKTRSSRQKFYSFLWQIEKKQESAKRKREEEKAEIAEKRVEKMKLVAEQEHIVYGLNFTSMFMRIYDSTINMWMNNRLTRAMQFAPKIVVDCSYEEYMNRAEASNCAKQLMLTFAENRSADNPFDIHFCSVNFDAYAAQLFHKFIPRMLDADFPINVHKESHLDLFPKERLVYLTPHCRNELTAYDPDDVYIIGAMVDKRNTDPLSLAKAKRQNLRMAKLPLDRYLQWTSGSGKSLTINQMISILLILKETSSWDKALQIVPRRKLHAVESNEEWIEKRLKNLKYSPRS